MIAGPYIATLTATDENQNTATASISFTVLTALQPPSNCEINPGTGTELSTTFTVQCAGSLPLGQYRYSFQNGEKETPLRFPGSARESFILPAGLAKNGFVGKVLIRADIPGSTANIQSSEVSLAVTVNKMVTNADTIGDTFKQIILSGSSDGGTTSAAAASSLVNKLSELSDDDARKTVDKVVDAMKGSTDLSKATVDTASKTSDAIGAIVSSGKLSEDTKKNVAQMMSAVADVLSQGAPPEVITNAMKTVVSTTPETKDSASADATTNTLNQFGKGLAAGLTVGDQTSISTGDTSLTVALSTPNTIPATLAASGTLGRRSTIVKASVQTGDGLRALLAEYDEDAKVVIQSTSMAQNVYPIEDANRLTATNQ